jgi:hypothetical protein
LDTEALSVEPVNVELTTETLRVDSLLQVVQANGDVVLLHIEFQGRRSVPAMALRQLGYLSQLIITHGIDTKLHSVVLYTERNAGTNDAGVCRIEDGHGNITLEWRYSPVLLWQISGEEILKIGRPALLPLVSLTRSDELPRVLSEVVAIVRQQTDEDLRARLFNGLLVLTSDEEVMKMIESLLDSDEYEFETPYLRRWREKGLTEGRAEGRAEGQLEGLKQAVLTLTASRFDPPFSKALILERYVDSISDEAKLQAVIAKLALASSFDAVLADLPNGAESSGA